MKNIILYIIQQKIFFSIQLDNNNYKLLFNFDVVKNNTISPVLQERSTTIRLFPSMVV